MNAEYMDFPFEIKANDVDESGIFTGYASIFNRKDDSKRYVNGIITEGDIVRPGAFSESIGKGGRNGNGIVMLWQHMSDQVPGVWKELVEDGKGLRAKGELLLETQLGKETHIRAKKKAIKGLSIGFDTLEFDLNEKTKIREIKKAELWEISLVTFPAQKKATIIDVKSLKEEIEKGMDERTLEGILRESGGLSKDAAIYIVSLCKQSLRESDNDGTKSTLEIIQKALDSLKI